MLRERSTAEPNPHPLLGGNYKLIDSVYFGDCLVQLCRLLVVEIG